MKVFTICNILPFNVIISLMKEVRNMPIGIQSFEIMRTCSYVYVDETQFIPKLEILGRAHFLARPRRFGKSLFISTFCKPILKAEKNFLRDLLLRVKYAFLYNLMAVYTDGKSLSQGEFRIGLFKEAMQRGDVKRVLTLIKVLMLSGKRILSKWVVEEG